MNSNLLFIGGLVTGLAGSVSTGSNYRNILPDQGNYYNPDIIDKNGKKRSEGYVTNLITDFSIARIRQRDESKPFCLLVHHKAVHRVWMPDKEGTIQTKYRNACKNGEYARMTDTRRQAWDDVYDPMINN